MAGECINCNYYMCLDLPEYLNIINEPKETKMNTKEMIEVLQAYEDGKTIQIYNHLTEKWENTPAPVWNFEFYRFRIKPEPKKIPLDSSDITPTTWIKVLNNDAKYIVNSWDEDSIYFYNGEFTVWLKYSELEDYVTEISTTPDKFNWRPAYKISQ